MNEERAEEDGVTSSRGVVGREGVVGGGGVDCTTYMAAGIGELLQVPLQQTADRDIAESLFADAKCSVSRGTGEGRRVKKREEEMKYTRMLLEQERLEEDTHKGARIHECIHEQDGEGAGNERTEGEEEKGTEGGREAIYLYKEHDTKRCMDDVQATVATVMTTSTQNPRGRDSACAVSQQGKEVADVEASITVEGRRAEGLDRRAQENESRDASAKGVCMCRC